MEDATTGDDLLKAVLTTIAEIVETATPPTPTSFFTALVCAEPSGAAIATKAVGRWWCRRIRRFSLRAEVIDESFLNKAFRMLVDNLDCEGPLAVCLKRLYRRLHVCIRRVDGTKGHSEIILT